MSRIEEALRRAGVTGARPVPDPEPVQPQASPDELLATTAGDHSAWDFAGDGRHRLTPPARFIPPARVADAGHWQRCVA